MKLTFITHWPERGAEYLLRFDDICPTMNWSMWRQIESELVKLQIRPILAVVPDNRDPVLRVGPAERGFWSLVRDWQRLGWTIALHGYQHRMVTLNSGLLGKNRYSEFAGLPETQQRHKLNQALSIFAEEGIHTEMFVAPAHSFDQATLRAVRAVGLSLISDGYSLYPHLDANGLCWIPQQLTKLTPKHRGVWTVCMHMNSWSQDFCDRFRAAAAAFRPAITDTSSVVARYGGRRIQWIDRVHAAYSSSNQNVRGALKGWLQ